MKSYLYALGTLIVLACICQDDIFVLLQPAPANEQKSAATAIVPADTAVVDTNIVEMTKETMSAYDRALPEPVKIAEKITVKNHIVINNDTAVKKVPQNVFDRSETVSLNGKTYRAGRRVDRLHRLCGKLFSDFVLLRSQMDDRIRDNRLR